MKLHYLSFLFLIHFCVFSQKSNLQQANMKGNIQLVKTTEYLTDDQGNLEKTSSMFSLFNSQGNMTELKVESELVKRTFRCQYNSQGQIITMTTFDEQQKEVSTNESLYNDKGQKIEEVLKMADGTIFLRIVSLYNDKGQIVETKNCGTTNNSCSDRKLFTYDDLGRVISESKLKPLSDKISQKEVFQYDAQSNKTQSEIYNEWGELVQKKVFEYDNQGNLIKTTPYDAFGILEGIETYKYEYDAQQNWIKKSMYIDQQLQSVTQQEIIYFTQTTQTKKNKKK